MQDVTSVDIQPEQDRVAAISDAALPSGWVPMMTWDGYSTLQQEPELTPSQQQQVQALASAMRVYGYSSLSKVEQGLGMALPPDGRR